jgi:hypothetical protein
MQAREESTMNESKPLEEIRERLERTEARLEELVKDLEERQQELEEACTLPGVPPIPRDFNEAPQSGPS